MSILLVVLSHASVTHGFPRPVFRALHVADLGNLGVRVFFVISGFLITGLLLRERNATGRISLRHFYFRRVFRILPAYYVYIAAAVSCAALGWLPAIAPRLVGHALTFTLNYANNQVWALGHFWSLAVEEQFYLLWPPILAWVGLRGSFRAALVFVVFVPVLRLALYLFAPGYHPYIGAGFESVADAIAVGCLLVRHRSELWEHAWYRRLLTSRWFVLLPLLVLVAAALDGRPRISYVVGIPVKNLGIALILDWAVRFPASRIGRFLNARPIVWIGTMSYSLYVWQQPFLDSHYRAPWIRFPFNLCYAFAAAVGSYYVIERPMLELRSRLERRSARARSGEAIAA